MKTIKQIREEYDNIVLDQVEILPEEIMLEGRDSKKISQLSPIPSSKEMPIMLVFRRIQYRIFPNKQVVALYYSKMINKYLSIPFGPDGNVNLSESVILDENDLLEDWSDVKHQSPTGGLKKSGVMAYRRENPGSKLQTAVTTKPSKLKPGSKAANRRKSFCARMGGMKKRLTSAKTARDPDSRINKALRKWNCEESFNERLQALREARGYNVGDLAWDAASFIPGPVGAGASLVSAKRSLERGDKVSAALDAAGAAPVLGYGSKIAKLGKLAKGAITARKATKTAEVASKVPKAAEVASTASKVGKVGKVGSAVSKVGKLASAASSVAGALLNPLEGSKPLGQSKAPQSNIKKGSVSVKSTDLTPVQTTKMRQAAMKENKMSDLRNMVNENISSIDLPINGRNVTLNTGMAKRILEVYDSVNTKNKKLVEGMLNEDMESFKKLLNFSIKA